MSKWIVAIHFGRPDNFKVVDKIPNGYMIWNINHIKGFPTYLPLCIVNPMTCSVVLDKLLAIDMHDATLVGRLTCCSTRFGAKTLNDARTALKICKGTPHENMLVESVKTLEAISE